MLAKERLRRRYRPKRVRILFVGEAPPASGRFFYQADSGLYRAIRDTFLRALPGMDAENFLSAFQANGCYLVDLCGKPVDHLAAKARKLACVEGEARLARILRKLRPDMVIVVVRSIVDNVHQAQDRAGWHGKLIELPYPGRWYHYRMIFQKKLVAILRTTFR